MAILWGRTGPASFVWVVVSRTHTYSSSDAPSTFALSERLIKHLKSAQILQTFGTATFVADRIRRKNTVDVLC
jgi:hypothetical protein